MKKLVAAALLVSMASVSGACSMSGATASQGATTPRGDQSAMPSMLPSDTPAVSGVPSSSAPSGPTPAAALDDARSVAQERLRESTGAACLGERRVTLDPDYLKQVVADASDRGGRPGWVRPGEVWLGGLPAGADAFAATLVSRDDNTAWVMSEADGDENWPDVKPGTPIIEELVAVPVAGGGNAWVKTGSAIVRGSC